MSRRNRAEAAVVRQYSQDMGIALRTAQLHAQNSHPEWQAFLRTRASLATAAMAAADEAGLRYSLEVESAVADVKDAVGRAKHVEEKAYKSLLAVQTLMEAAIATRDVNLQSVIQAQTAAQKAWQTARRERESAEVSAGSLLPANDLAEIERRFLQPLRSLLQSMPVELAGMVSGFDGDQVRQQCEVWRDTRFFPALDAAAAAVAAKLPNHEEAPG